MKFALLLLPRLSANGELLCGYIRSGPVRISGSGEGLVYAIVVILHTTRGLCNESLWFGVLCRIKILQYRQVSIRISTTTKVFVFASDFLKCD